METLGSSASVLSRPGRKDGVPGVLRGDALQRGQLGPDPGGELPGGLAGERHAEDFLGPDPAVGDEPHHAVRHGGGLSRAGAGDDQPGRQGRGNDGGLLGVGLFFSPSSADSSSGLNRGREGPPDAGRWRRRLGGHSVTCFPRRHSGQTSGSRQPWPPCPPLAGSWRASKGAAGHDAGGIAHHVQRPVLLRVQRLPAPGRRGFWWWCRAGPGRHRPDVAAGRRRGRQSRPPARRPGRRPAAGAGPARLCRAAVSRS